MRRTDGRCNPTEIRSVNDHPAGQRQHHDYQASPARSHTHPGPKPDARPEGPSTGHDQPSHEALAVALPAAPGSSARHVRSEFSRNDLHALHLGLDVPVRVPTGEQFLHPTRMSRPSAVFVVGSVPDGAVSRPERVDERSDALVGLSVDPEVDGSTLRAARVEDATARTLDRSDQERMKVSPPRRAVDPSVGAAGDVVRHPRILAAGTGAVDGGVRPGANRWAAGVRPARLCAMRGTRPGRSSSKPA